MARKFQSIEAMYSMMETGQIPSPVVNKVAQGGTKSITPAEWPDDDGFRDTLRYAYETPGCQFDWSDPARNLYQVVWPESQGATLGAEAGLAISEHTKRALDAASSLLGSKDAATPPQPPIPDELLVSPGYVVQVWFKGGNDGGGPRWLDVTGIPDVVKTEIRNRDFTPGTDSRNIAGRLYRYVKASESHKLNAKSAESRNPGLASRLEAATDEALFDLYASQAFAILVPIIPGDDKPSQERVAEKVVKYVDAMLKARKEYLSRPK